MASLFALAGVQQLRQLCLEIRLNCTTLRQNDLLGAKFVLRSLAGNKERIDKVHHPVQ